MITGPASQSPTIEQPGGADLHNKENRTGSRRRRTAEAGAMLVLAAVLLLLSVASGVELTDAPPPGESNKEIGHLEAWYPNIRLAENASLEDRTKVHAGLNYTRKVRLEGYECMGEMQSTNLTNKFVNWFVTDGATIAYLEAHTFECTPMTRVAEILNCDATAPRTTINGKPVIPGVDVFNGRASCADLTAAMNILHGEEPNDEGRLGRSGRHLADSDAYPDSCAGTWRSCPYNMFYSGKITPMQTSNDLRFHQHAHNIQGNWKGWQGCGSSYYMDMQGWERHKRSTYYAQFDTFIDIYEGGLMQKCTAQDDWFVHIKGYAFGTFCATQELKARSTHTCGAMFRSNGDYCFSSNQEYCLMDFDTIQDDNSKCNSVQSGPRTLQHTNAWCCGVCQ